MAIGNKIASARKAKNMTQEQLAEMMSVTRQSVSRWESEQSYPEMDKIGILAEVLGVSCDYLLREEQEVANSRTESKNPVTRLLYAAKGKKVKLDFYDDFLDIDLLNETCVITDFDGQWMRVEYKKGKKEKLIPISSLMSVQYLKEGK